MRAATTGTATGTTPLRPLIWSQDMVHDYNDNTDNDNTTKRLEMLAKATNYLSDVKMIVFDKDGTLGNDKASLQRWAVHMTTQLQGLLDDDDEDHNTALPTLISNFHKSIGWDDIKQDVVPSAPLAAGTWDENVRTLSNYLIQYGHDSSLAATWHDQIELHGADEPLIPNLREMLIDCQQYGLVVAVCTSDVRDSTDLALANWKVQDVISYSITADEVEHPKPSAEPLEVLCQRVTSDAIKPHNCIVVGDTISDTKMARNAKASFCIGVLTGSGTPEILTDAGADIILPHVGHIPSLLEAMKTMAPGGAADSVLSDDEEEV